MINEYCTICKNKHFNNYACSNCGAKYSDCVPTFHYGSASSENFNKNIKFCPLCGHEFKYKPIEVGKT